MPEALYSEGQPPDWEWGLLPGSRYTGMPGPSGWDVICKKEQQTLRGTEPLPGRQSSRVGLLSGTEFCVIFQIKPELFFSTVPFCLFFPLSPRPWLPACVQLHPRPRCQPLWFLCNGSKHPSWNSSSLPTPGHKPTGRSVPEPVPFHPFPWPLPLPTSPSPDSVSGTLLTPATPLS